MVELVVEFIFCRIDPLLIDDEHNFRPICCV